MEEIKRIFFHLIAWRGKKFVILLNIQSAGRTLRCFTQVFHKENINFTFFIGVSNYEKERNHYNTR